MLSMFWSGEKLQLEGDRLVSPFDAARIDCAAYTLSLGGEVFVSPSEKTSDEALRSIRYLAEGGGVRIPPGQLAFLLTDESVFVPHNAIAFISIKARLKFRGLINVSGFHADPGYRGRLIFSVVNAGPAEIHLRRGDPCFLIWFAGLDQTSKFVKYQPGWMNVPSDLVSNVAGEFKTLEGVSNRIDEAERTLSDRIHAVEKAEGELESRLRVLVSIAVAMAAAIVILFLSVSVESLRNARAVNQTGAPAAHSNTS